jgi:Bacterial Ig-like domain (group 2)/Viral BACON domain
MKLSSCVVRVVACFVAALILPVAAAAQVLSVSPQTLSVQGVAGSTPPSASVNISNTGKRALKWSVSVPTANWLRVSPTNGVNTGRVTVSFPSPVAAGNHTASFVVTGAGSSVTITVNLNIAAPPSLTGLSVTGPTSLNSGQTAQYTARATYSDGSSLSLTTGPAWSTSNSSIAAITQGGLLTALAAGTVAVQATYGGLTAQSAGVVVAPPTIAPLVA